MSILFNVLCFIFFSLFATCANNDGNFTFADGNTCELTSSTITTGPVFDLVSRGNVTIKSPSSGTSTLQAEGTIVTVEVAIDLTVENVIILPRHRNNLISVTNGGLILYGVQIGNNIVSEVNCAVIFLSEFRLLNITDSQFIKIQNIIVPNPVVETYGGVIHGETSVKEAKIDIRNSNFSGNSINSSRGYGGAFVITTTGRKTIYNIVNSNFTDCWSGYYAGAFDLYSYYFYPSVVIDNCVFTKCSCGRDAGAIYVVGNDGNVTNCLFVECTALNEGGGVYFYDDGVLNSYFLVSCSFQDCKSLGETGREANGGGLYVETNGKVLVWKCNFTNCVANAYHGHGGAIANVVLDFFNFTIRDSIFTGCSVDEFQGTTPKRYDDGDGGAVSIKLTVFNTVIIEGCQFNDCSALNNGGSLDLVGGSLILRNTNFTNSKAEKGNGGSIHTTGVIITIEKTKFVNSQLGNSSSKGVEIYSTRDILHYGEDNQFACAGGNNDVVYGDISLNLVVCENKTISDLDCSATCPPVVECPSVVDCPPASFATHSTPMVSLFHSFVFGFAALVLASGIFLL